MITPMVPIMHPVYRGEFRYQPDPGTKAVPIRGFKDTEIAERLKGNIIEVGVPERWDLKELCKREGIKLPVRMEMSCDEFDFWLIQSPFSFVPAPGNQFKWARIVVRMEALSESMENPIALDGYPRDIYNEKKEKHRIVIGSNLKFVELRESWAEYASEIEFKRLEPGITVAGIGTSELVWDFPERAVSNLEGVNALYITMKTPIKSKGIKISHFFYAQIHTKWGGIIPTTARALRGEGTYEIKF